MIPYNSVSVVLKDLYDEGRQYHSLVIPEYQRSYLWKTENFEKLIDSFLENFSSLNSIRSKTFFLGAFIFSSSKYDDNRTLDPFDIVDGQQRITSLSLLMMCLCKTMYEQYDKYLADPESDFTSKTWFESEFKAIKDLIIEFLFVQQNVRATQGNLKNFMPRIIRQNDKRDAEPVKHKYESSIAQVLDKFKNYLSDPDGNFSIIPANEKIDTRTIIEAWDYFTKEIGIINFNVNANEKDTKYTYVPFKNFSKTQYKSLFENSDFSFDNIQTNISKRLFRLILLSNFLLKKTAITLIKCTEPNDAYDIFDTLNTTGLPLTALEILKPQIVLYYQNNDIQYENSAVQNYFDDIDGYLDEFYEDTTKRHNETKKIIVASKLLIKGDKLSESLTEQRRFLNKLQKEFERNEIPDKLVKYLRYLTEYRAFFFNRKSFQYKLDEHLNTLQINQKDANLIKLLSSLFLESNTHLVVPLLTRYYINSLENRNFDDYILFIKALATFLVLRRAVTGRTGGIDKSFRDIFKKNNNLNFNGLTLDGDDHELPDINQVKNVLISKLKNNILTFNLDEKEKWVNHVSKMPLYRDTKTISRFMILAAYDNTINDPDENGLVTNECAPHVSRKFLSYKSWQDDIYSTIEHIAPSTEREGSDYENAYDETYTKDTLGNLILIPKMLNVYLSNNDWKVKKNIYSAISTADTNSRKSYLEKAQENGLNINQNKINDLINFEETSEILQGLSDFQNFNAETIQKRSERICSLVWDRLIPWIKPVDND